MSSTLQFGCNSRSQAALLLLILLAAASKLAGQTDSEQAHPNCSCPDGRQFSIGSSLFGKNSARIVITGFHRDLVKAGPPPCKDLTVVGQAVRLQVVTGHPFLRREDRKRGTITDICQTKIQFAQPSKSYDFFKDDGSAVNLSDIEAAQTLPDNGTGPKPDTPEATGDHHSDDLTGNDPIRML